MARRNSFGLIIKSAPNGECGSSLFILVNPHKETVTITIPDFVDRKSTQILLGTKSKSFGLLNPISIQVWRVGE